MDIWLYEYSPVQRAFHVDTLEKILAEVDGLGKGDDAAWIRRTFARYVTDEASLMQYVLEALA